MRRGTPGFIGLRLKEGREARGLTASSLASMLEVTRQHVTRIEAEDATPSPEIMKKICETLKLPHHFFFRPVRDFPGETIFYRSMSSATKTARIKAEQRLKWLRDIVLYLQEYVNFPALKFPEFDLPAVPSKISDEMIEDVTSEVRRFWGLGSNPIVNLVGLLEQHCTIISRDYMDAQTLDALSLWGSIECVPYIVLNADK
jgi:transcriptional regulator with XRE-family HTH domain